MVDLVDYSAPIIFCRHIQIFVCPHTLYECRVCNVMIEMKSGVYNFVAINNQRRQWT